MNGPRMLRFSSITLRANQPGAISAAKNGLFLSVYEARLIPYAVIFAALLTAFVAIIFTGVVAGTDRRTLATGLTAVLGFSVIACRTLFEINPLSAFVVYLWLSAVQVLVLTHAWDYAGSMLTGRQAKRLLPLIGVGASIGAITGCVLWIAASAGFAFYVANFGSYNESFGTLAGVIVLLMWFWISAFIILLGAELNAEIEAQTRIDTTIGPDALMGERADTLGRTVNG